MPYREEYTDYFVSDIFGRVMISIMPRASARARIMKERRLLFSGRIKSELVNLFFNHFNGKWNSNDVIG